MQVRGLIESTTTGPTTGTVRVPGPWGLSLRGKTSHATPIVASWQTVLSNTESLIERWRNTLSGGQRNQWNLEASSYAVQNRHGRTKHLNGWQLFMRDNMARIRAGITPRNIPGTTQPPPPFSITDLAPVAGPIYQVSFNQSDPWITDANAMCVLIDRGLLDAPKNYRNQRAAVVTVIPGVSGTGYPMGTIIIRPFTASPQSQFIIDGYSITRN